MDASEAQWISFFMPNGRLKFVAKEIGIQCVEVEVDCKDSLD
jgi:hypothetical protein